MDNSIRKFLQDIAYTAGVAADEAKNCAHVVGKVVSSKADSAKANMQILTLRADMEEIFAEIGRIIYLMNTGSFDGLEINDVVTENDPNKTINDLLVKATEKQGEIDFLTDKISTLKGNSACPACGKSCKTDEIFCSVCGTRVKPAEPETAKADAPEEEKND
ncbi:MAG: hypothetical protein RR902_00455 [Oscillospiraceae bacterium]